MLKLTVQALFFCVALTALNAQEIPAREVFKAPADHLLPHFRVGPPIHEKLTSFGTDTMDALMKLWIAGFNKAQPGVSINLESRPSLSVPAALTAGNAQLAPLSREMNPSEIESFRATHGYGPTEIAVALGSYRTPTRTVALTFYVNDANPVTRLSLGQLNGIWCATPHRGVTSPITEWGQLGLTGRWVHEPVQLVGVRPPDGVPNFISRVICDNSPLRSGICGEKNGEPTSVLTRIVKDIAGDPDALGYAGFRNRQPGTHAVLIGNTTAGPYYRGTFDEVRTAVYPLTRFVYIYINHPPAQPVDAGIEQFLEYVLSFEGQRKVEEEGIFMPLPPKIAEQQRAKLAR